MMRALFVGWWALLIVSQALDDVDFVVKDCGG